MNKATTIFIFYCLTFSLFGQEKRGQIIELNSKSEEVFRNDPTLALDYAQSAKKIAFETNDEFGVALSQLSIIKVLVEQFKLEDALAKIDSTLIILERLKDDSLLGKAYLLRGDALTFDLKYDQAIESLLTSINHYDSANHSQGLASAYNSIGIAFDEYQNPEKALFYYNKSLIISAKYDFVKTKSSTLVNIGVVYLNRGNYDKARSHFNEAIEIFKKINSSKGIVYATNNIAITYKAEKRYIDAIELYNQVLEMATRDQDTNSVLRALNNMANVYIKIPDYKKALELHFQSLRLAENYNAKKQISKSYNNIAYTYALLEDYKQAYEFRTKSYKLKMKIFNSENSKKALVLEEQYQSKVKENEILQLNNENQKKETVIARSKLLLLVSITTSLLLVLVGIFIINRRKNKYRLTIQEEKIRSIQKTLANREEEKVRIGKSLHDDVVGELIKLYYDTELEHPELSQKILKTSNYVRTISHHLDNRPQHGEILIERLAELIPTSSKLEFQLLVLPDDLTLFEPLGTHLYRITQELINNSLKHANAKGIDIQINQANKLIMLSYKDDGIGVKKLKYGNGLLNISDRIKILKGEIDIKTSPNQGFNIHVKIPLSV